MSVFRSRELSCPRCERISRRSVATSINGGRTRAYRDAILAGTFQRFTCPHCGQGMVADGPFLYVDFEAGHWFACFPRHWETAWRELEREPADSWRRAMVQSSPDRWREEAEDYAVRAVFGLNVLREKLLCADAGLSDVDLELVKLDLMRRPRGPLLMDAAARPLLVAADDDHLMFIASGVDPDGQPANMRFGVPRSAIEETRAPAWSAARHELASGPYVDVGRLVIAGTAPNPSHLARAT